MDPSSPTSFCCLLLFGFGVTDSSSELEDDTGDSDRGLFADSGTELWVPSLPWTGTGVSSLLFKQTVHVTPKTLLTKASVAFKRLLYQFSALPKHR